MIQFKLFDDKLLKKPSKKELYDLVEEQGKEIERLKSIIKEVRELLNQDKTSASFNTAERNALEILDKVSK